MAAVAGADPDGAETTKGHGGSPEDHGGVANVTRVLCNCWGQEVPTNPLSFV